MGADGGNNFISMRRAARMLGVTPKTLRNWCRERRVSYFVTPTHRKCFKEKDLRDRLEKSYVPALDHDGQEPR